jgi:orotate phosphoribosyltransferase
MKAEKIGLLVIKAGVLDIRKVPLKVTNKEVGKLPLKNQPFLYTSGNWGPGYVAIKNLVARKKIIKSLAHQLARKIVDTVTRVDFVAGNVSGGVIPGWLLSEELEILLSKTVPFVYIREASKKGGHKELITGIANNPEIPLGSNCLVVEELVNFAQTICNGANALREAGYTVTHAATILFYNNPEAIKTLKKCGIEIVYLFTLEELLKIAEKYRTHPYESVNDFREFLRDPIGWQRKRGLRSL